MDSKICVVAIGSLRPPKMDAVRAVINQIAEFLGVQTNKVRYIAQNADSGITAMPLSIHEMRRGARNRASEIRRSIEADDGKVDFAIGLEGGLFILRNEKTERVHLQSWAYVEMKGKGYYGSSMSMPVPSVIAHEVIEKKQELGKVIDKYARRHNVRNSDGTFGHLSRGFISRQQSFEMALLGAFAPFYHRECYNMSDK